MCIRDRFNNIPDKKYPADYEIRWFSSIADSNYRSGFEYVKANFEVWETTRGMTPMRLPFIIIENINLDSLWNPGERIIILQDSSNTSTSWELTFLEPSPDPIAPKGGDIFSIFSNRPFSDDKFNFTFRPSKWDRDTVHVWRAKNRVNDLVYGYSGIKLFPTQKVLDLQGKKVTDFTTSVSDKFKPVQVVASEVAYDTDPFNTWKAAFRECVKLQSGIIDRQKQKETSERLDVWCSVGNGNMGAYSIEGARAGKDYAVKNKDNKEALSLINDFEWLQEQFNGI